MMTLVAFSNERLADAAALLAARQRSDRRNNSLLPARFENVEHSARALDALRRQTRPVSSTLLWKRAVEDLQVNAPFQRIRNNLLLWLQLLILALAAFTLGKPMIDAEERSQDTLVLLIDQSASMGRRGSSCSGAM